MTERGYTDLQQHIEVLRERGLLWEIDDPIDKDAVMHPFVRWQFRGGIPESQRRAFLFTNVVDANGRSYDHPVLIAGLAGSPQIYAAGLGCEVAEVPERWSHAFTNPLEPVIVDEGPCQQVVITGDALKEEGGGLLDIPIPISTPGFDNAPYLTSAHAITKDPRTGARNVGHYRGQVRSATTCSLYFSSVYKKHGHRHWLAAQEAEQPLDVAIFVGSPITAYAAVQIVPYGVDELTLAGGLAREPIKLVRCRTVDLEVPADAQIVIEGRLRTDVLVPEAPFAESHGYVHPRALAPLVEVTAITHRTDYVWTSFISQVTPSESSVIKKVGFEPLIERYLRETLGIDGLRRVVMHEPLTNLRKVVFVQFDFGAKQTEVWRALKGVASYSGIGKIVVAVDEDIDPDNLDAVWWAIAYRHRPHLDLQTLRGQAKGHGPPFIDGEQEWEDSNLLINATLKFPLPPVSLPTREFMEKARGLWEEIAGTHGLPQLTPESPWHGYVITPEEWPDELADEAALATAGRWLQTGAKLAARREDVR